MANIVRWDDPFAGMANVHSQLDDFFNTIFAGAPAVSQAGLSSGSMDVYTVDDKELVAEVHLSGYDKDDVDVNVHKGILEIKAEKHAKTEDKDKKRTYMVRESRSSFYRRLALPEYADEDRVDAQYTDGVLKITIPFKELPKPKKISISSGKK